MVYHMSDYEVHRDGRTALRHLRHAADNGHSVVTPHLLKCIGHLIEGEDDRTAPSTRSRPTPAPKATPAPKPKPQPASPRHAPVYKATPTTPPGPKTTINPPTDPKNKKLVRSAEPQTHSTRMRREVTNATMNHLYTMHACTCWTFPRRVCGVCMAQLSDSSLYDLWQFCG